jgi:metal-responsive CopG/Arc/MetJ family transcriptional regulator
MRMHKLEIELTDDLLSKIERISERTSHSTEEVVVNAIKNLKDEDESNADSTRRRLAVLSEVSAMAKALNIQRTDEDILSQIREFRGDA